MGVAALPAWLCKQSSMELRFEPVCPAQAVLTSPRPPGLHTGKGDWERPATQPALIFTCDRCQNFSTSLHAHVTGHGGTCCPAPWQLTDGQEGKADGLEGLGEPLQAEHQQDALRRLRDKQRG